jgi:hypothetical protein
LCGVIFSVALHFSQAKCPQRRGTASFPANTPNQYTAVNAVSPNCGSWRSIWRRSLCCRVPALRNLDNSGVSWWEMKGKKAQAKKGPKKPLKFAPQLLLSALLQAN